MALLPDVFTPDEAESNPFEPIEPGWYVAEIVKSELKTTKDKTGKYISFTFKILEGEHEGRLMYTNLNIVNKSDIAVKIARSDLKAICEAVGHTGELDDTDDLHNSEMAIKVSKKPETSRWPAKNEIKAYKPATEISPADSPFDSPFES